jgi:hypothetical protein
MLANFHVFATGHLTSSLFWVFVQRQLVCHCISGLRIYPMLMGQDIMTLQEPTYILARIVDTKSIQSSQQPSKAKISQGFSRADFMRVCYLSFEAPF